MYHLLILTMPTYLGNILEKCHMCEYRSDVKDKVIGHIKLVHSQKQTKIFKCGKCDFKHADKDVLLAHFNTDHSQGVIKCEFCDLRGQNQSDFEEHQCQQQVDPLLNVEVQIQEDQA